MEKTAYTMACSVYGNLFDFYDNPIAASDTRFKESFGISTDELMKFDINGTFKDLFDTMSNGYSAISLLGSILVFIYFLLEIGEVSVNDGFTYESFLRLGIKTIVGILIIKNGMEIIGLGFTTCSNIYEELTANNLTMGAEAVFTEGNCIYDRLASAWGLIAPLVAIGEMIGLAIPYLLLLLLSMSITLTCWIRIMDLTIRVMFAPIGMADMLKSGHHTSGINYFKKLLASALQGAVLAAVVIAFMGVKNAMFSQSLMGAFGTVVVGLALLTTLKKAGDIAREVVGI